MKRIFALFLVLAMMVCCNNVVFAAEPDETINLEEMNIQNVQPRLIDFLNFNGDIYDSSSSNSFTVSSKINLKLSIATTKTCTVKLIKIVGNRRTAQRLDNGQYYITVNGGESAKSHSLKTNCGTGTYCLEFHSSDGAVFYGAYILSGTTAF